MTNNQDIKKQLNTPLKIGNKKIDKRVILAPMAGLNHIGFRMLLREFGGYGLLFTGMLNARAVPKENRYKSNVFKWDDNELDLLGTQIFGDEPAVMAEAAKRMEDEGFFCIDLNFGCSVGTICVKNYGAALLKQPDLAVKIVEEVRKKVEFPVFVKFRTGWSDDIEEAAKLAKRFENAGADALTFHPRVAPDKRSRPPKWPYIGVIKESVSIPVFGNGNIFTHDDVKKVLNLTNCDALSIGRVAVAKPWIFSSWTDGKIFDYSVYKSTLKKALSLYLNYFDEPYAVKLFKKFYVYFYANFKFGNQFSGIMLRAGNTEAEILDAIERLFENSPEVVEKPNINLFVN